LSRRPTILLLALTAAGGLAGCARDREGVRILESMRRDGLILDDGVEVAPASPAPDDAPAWPPEGEVSLAMLLEAADRFNPRLAAARAEIGAAGGQAWQAGLYPNPTIGIESENVRPSDGGFGTSETTFGVEQPIIVGGRREAAVATAEAGVVAARWELERLRREIHGRVRREVTEILHLRRALALHRELRDLANRTSEIARTRFDARAAPESEAIRARVEANALGLSIERIEGDLAAAGARLASLLGGRPVDIERLGDDRLDPAGAAPLPPLDRLEGLVAASHPAVLSSEARLEQAVRRVDLERARRRADLTARVGVGIDHDDDEGFVEAGLGVPLPLFDGNEGNVLTARFQVIRAGQEAKAVSNELRGALAAAWLQWQSADRRLGVYDTEILDGARRAHGQARQGYEAGKLPFLDLLDAQRTLIEARLARLELVRAVALARADIHAIAGDDLDLPPGDSS
jgi:cobalt-zinc-cadmium efflux system outer membrane protein